MSVFTSDAVYQSLINPITRAPDLEIRDFDGACPRTVERSRYYSLILVNHGKGTIAHDFAEQEFVPPCILFFAPFQPFVFKDKGATSGITLLFSSDFYCLERHREEISCNGLLFNNVYDTPKLQLTTLQAMEFEQMIDAMREELRGRQPDSQLLLAQLKILLIKATRVKKLQGSLVGDVVTQDVVRTKLRNLQQLVESNFRKLKAPSAYSEMLNISTKALGRIVKTHLGKTLSQLIHERVVVEAKRELVLSDKPIKQIASDLGYEDPFYFSRLFKKLSDVSPEYFRLQYRRS